MESLIPSVWWRWFSYVEVGSVWQVSGSFSAGTRGTGGTGHLPRQHVPRKPQVPQTRGYKSGAVSSRLPIRPGQGQDRAAEHSLGLQQRSPGTPATMRIPSTTAACEDVTATDKLPGSPPQGHLELGSIR